MDKVFVYLIPLPDGINEYVMPCADDCYTVYIDCSLDEAHRLKAYSHALKHIRNDDFRDGDVNQIESKAHEEE